MELLFVAILSLDLSNERKNRHGDSSLFKTVEKK